MGSSGGNWKDIPMLAQLVEEADTAKFYAYCEEVRLDIDPHGHLTLVSINKETVG